jgi:hypothetical protein
MDSVLLTVQRVELVSCGATFECMLRVGAVPYNIINRVMFVVTFVSLSTAFIGIE